MTNIYMFAQDKLQEIDSVHQKRINRCDPYNGVLKFMSD